MNKIKNLMLVLLLAACTTTTETITKEIEVSHYENSNGSYYYNGSLTLLITTKGLYFSHGGNPIGKPEDEVSFYSPLGDGVYYREIYGNEQTLTLKEDTLIFESTVKGATSTTIYYLN